MKAIQNSQVLRRIHSGVTERMLLNSFLLIYFRSGPKTCSHYTIPGEQAPLYEFGKNFGPVELAQVNLLAG